MNDILMLAAAALMVVAVVLLIILLARQSRLEREQRQGQHQQSDMLQRLTYDLFDELDHQRDEHAAALSEGNAALLNTLTQLGQSQTAALESMQRQVLLSTRNQEERAGQMSASVAASLSQLDARMEQVQRCVERETEAAQ